MMTRRAASAALASSALLTVSPILVATGALIKELPPPRSKGGIRLATKPVLVVRGG